MPLVNGSAPVYPVHVDDVCDAILAIAQSNEPSCRGVRVAPDTSVRFADYLRTLASRRLGRPIVTVSLPTAAIAWGNRLAAKTRWLPSVPEERLIGLAALKPMRERPGFTPTPVPLRDVRDALAAEGYRRRLLLEGRTLLRYILGRRVPAAQVRRYVRAVLNEDDSSPLSLPLAVYLWPQTMRVLEPVGDGASGKLRRRLSIAMRLAEMTPTGAAVFHNYAGGSRITSALRLACSVAVEACLLPIRALASRPASRSDRSAEK